MKPNLIFLPQLLPVICKVSGSSYLNKDWLSAHKLLVYNIRISESSVATCLRCGGNINIIKVLLI